MSATMHGNAEVTLTLFTALAGGVRLTIIIVAGTFFGVFYHFYG